jgi:hypothetical protein
LPSNARWSGCQGAGPVKPLPPKAVAGRPGFTRAKRPRLQSPPADRWAAIQNLALARSLLLGATSPIRNSKEPERPTDRNGLVTVLLDECVDWRLGRELAPHEVKTARQMGWTTIKNGELLALASARFDAFVTVDRNLSFRQDIVSFPIAVLVLRREPTDWPISDPSYRDFSRPSMVDSGAPSN